LARDEKHRARKRSIHPSDFVLHPPLSWNRREFTAAPHFALRF
jgi:hypothetical protein